MRDALEDEKRQNAASYLHLFRGRAMLYRTGLLLAVAFFSQYAGSWVASGFTGLVNGYFGFNTEQAKLGAGIVPGIVGFITSQIACIYLDRIGRRPLLLYGQISYSVCFFLILFCLLAYNPSVDLSDKTPATGSIAWAVIAFVILQIFSIIYSFCWTPLNALYPVEILPYSARAKGMALCQLFINAANVVQSWVLVYATNAWGFHFFAFFGCFNAFASVIIWKYFPETKGLTLEAIDSIFQDPNPVAKSLEPRVLSTVEEGLSKK